MAEAMLHIQGLTVAYGGIQAVKGLSFQVQQGELVCLIGCNGAGKTSTMKAIAGLLPFQAHTASFNETIDLTTLPAHQRLPNGLALVPEGRGIFTRMTVLENLELGANTRLQAGVPKAQILADLEKMLTLFPRIKERLKQSAGTLSGGEQQMLAVARALMGKPKLLLLDEPSMGLAPLMVEKIFEVLEQVHREGMTILLVEQNAHIALQLANRAYVMDSGLIEYEGLASELINDPRIRETYLGQVSQ
jgi:branched-chain amino acid transport system ATP-binding protein